MDKTQSNKLKISPTLLQQFEQATNNASQHYKATKTQSSKVLPNDSSQFLNIHVYSKTTTYNNIQSELNSENFRNSIQNKIKPPVPPKPTKLISECVMYNRNSVSDKNCDKINGSIESEVALRSSTVNIPKIDCKTKRQLFKNSRHQISFTRTFDLLNFEDEKYENDAFEETSEHTKSTLVIQELINTEECYVKNLAKILLYKADLEKILPIHVKDNVIREIFCNVEDIHREQAEFLKLLKRSKNERDVIKAFILKESMFELYIPYSRNKPTSDKVSHIYEERIKNTQENLQDPLDLSSYLLNPIQRLGRYILLLGEIEKDLKSRMQDTQFISSTKIKIQNLMRRINDYLSIDLIIKLPPTLDLTEEGSFVLKECFKLLKPFRLDIMAFLFQNVIVITIPSNNQSECLYIKHINLETVSLISREVDPLIFSLKIFDNIKHIDDRMDTYEFQAEKPKIKRHWEEILRKVLWEQFEAVKAAENKRRSTIGNDPYSDGAVDYIKSNRPLQKLVDQFEKSM